MGDLQDGFRYGTKEFVERDIQKPSSGSGQVEVVKVLRYWVSCTHSYILTRLSVLGR